jgi:hypothetical protein
MDHTMETTTYEQQAADFMTKTGATMKAELLGNMPHFDDAEEARDVYQITLTRGKQAYSFRFGQSIADSGTSVNRNRNGKTIHDRKLITRKRIIPTEYDILAAVQKYDVGTFADFCSDFGYDEDSRKAEKIYFAVQKEWAGIERVFGDVIEELREIN